MITVRRTKGRRNVYLDGRPIGLIETRIKDQFRNRAYGLEFVFVPNEDSPISAHFNYRAKTVREILFYMNRHPAALEIAR
jgi:hypothetical protein